MKRILSLWLLLAACSEAGDSRLEVGTDDFGADPDTAGLVRLDVYPPTNTELRDARGDLLPLRPQTFLVEAADGQMMRLELTPAVDLGGLVEGRSLTPFPTDDSEVPTVDRALAGAELRFGLAGGGQQPRTTTTDDGFYDVPVVPATSPYDLVVIPDDPLVPVTLQQVDITGRTDTLDLFLEAGVPLWGRVTTPGGVPVPNMPVRAVHPRGAIGPATLTDSRGRYLLAVHPDQSWTVVAEGRPAVPEPVLRAETGPVDPSGQSLDLQVPDVGLATLRGSVRLPSGAAPTDDAVRVRVVATELPEVPGQTASYTDEVGTDDGVFTAVVPTGTYRVEIAPQDPTGPQAVVLSDVEADSGITLLDPVDLEALRPRFGTVRDPDGEPVGDAVVTCTEEGFAARSWSATTDPSGQFILGAPGTPLRCRLTPPAVRPDLALSAFAPSEDELLDPEARWNLLINAGTLVTGQVLSRGAADLGSPADVPMANAVVEVRDPAGNLLGITLTDEDGRFGVQVNR